MTAFYSGGGAEGLAVYYSSFDTQNDIADTTLNLATTDIDSYGQNRPKTAGSGDTLAIVWQEVYDGSIEIGMSISTVGFSGLSEESFRVTDVDSHQQYPSIVYSGNSFHVVYDDAGSGTVMYNEISFGYLGIDDEELSLFQMGPNPCKNSLNIQRESSGTDKLIITDLLGRTVHYEIINGQNITLDLSILKPGLYMVSLGDAKYKAQKLLVQ